MRNFHINLNPGNSFKAWVLFFYFAVMVYGTKAQSYTLTISKSGSGGGTVTSDVGGINCGPTCSAVFASGTTVIITQTPDATSSFSGWSGAATGTGTTATITMNSNKSVSANFSRNTYALNIFTAGTGSGNVISTPAGISCPGDCAENYLAGSYIILTATPGAGSVFTGWSGACSGTGTCNISIESASNVTATFTYESSNYYPDNDGDGFGAGAVIVAAIQPPNTSINNTDCDDTNPSVHPGAAEICGNETDDDCNGQLDDCFMYTLTISKSGSGGGTVTSNVGGINCGATCTYSYPPGTNVVITQTPDATSSFSGWSGAATGTGTTATITMNSNKSVSANFSRNTYALNIFTAGTGSGNVTSTPAGISCPGDCAENYLAGSSVNLTATPGAGSVFTGWSGACSGTGNCSFTIMANSNVSATFCLLPGNAGIISGNGRVCAGTTQTYSIAPVSNATSYTWTLPSGWTGSSSENSITAIAGNSGTITVVAVNPCGSGIARSMGVTVDPSPQDLDVKSGLVAYYPFNNNAIDESVNNNHGTVNGPVPVNDKNFKPSGAFSFDGVDDYIMVKDPVPSALQIQNEITLSAWIYVVQYPGTSNLGLIVGSQCDACGARGASIFLDGRRNSDGQPSPAGHIHFQIGDGSWHQANSNSQVPLNQWVHIAATRKANENAKIYYNGVLQPSTSTPWTGFVSYTGAYFAMGRQKDYGDRFFKGSMDEVRVYDRALNEREIKTLFQDKAIYVTRDSLCQNESTTIHLSHSENDVSYQLLKDGSEEGNSLTGNGSELIFNTGTLTSTSQFTLKATNNAGGCNLILDTVLAVTVNPVYAFTEDHSICAGETFTWHGTDYTEAGTYESAYSTITGCDSIYTLHLTINPVYAYTEDQSICAGETYTWHGTDYSEAGTYESAYSTITGCDSIYTLHLAVIPVYAFTEDQSICAGETYTWRGTDYTEAGTYESAYSTINGCDSIYTLHLAVNPVYAFTEDQSICAGETYTWQGTDYTEAGTYESAYSTISGCDSIYTLHLAVNPVYAFTEDQSICAGETFSWHGTDFTEAGTYESAYSTITGCDSIYTLHLDVNTVDVTITQDGSLITANAVSAAYQWLDCGNNFLPVAGETSQSFTAMTGGSYAVEVTQNECTDTSVSIEIVPTLINAHHQDGVFIYPNPVINELIIENKGNIEKIKFEILNSSGQVVFTGNLYEKEIVNTRDFLPGLYMIKLKNGLSLEVKKIIKE